MSMTERYKCCNCDTMRIVMKPVKEKPQCINCGSFMRVYNDSDWGDKAKNVNYCPICGNQIYTSLPECPACRRERYK